MMIKTMQNSLFIQTESKPSKVAKYCQKKNLRVNKGFKPRQNCNRKNEELNLLA